MLAGMTANNYRPPSSITIYEVTYDAPSRPGGLDLVKRFRSQSAAVDFALATTGAVYVEETWCSPRQAKAWGLQ